MVNFAMSVNMRKRSDEADKVRLLSKVSTNNAGCWIWKGEISPGGYGRGWFRGRNRTVARMAYRLFIGEIPTGASVIHKCGVNLCVNPNHLDTVILDGQFITVLKTVKKLRS